ncbi:MAG: hypothetical protein JXB44_12875, partial [Calditrichaceae bacterium]
MKSILFLLWITVFIQYGWGQVVYSEPSFPSEEDSIIIYFNAAEGDKGLMGYIGDDVYAHTGVITNFGTGWKYVVAEWTVNIEKARLSRIAADLYKLVIGFPRDYYGLTNPEEKIEKLAFVFRNSNASRTGRDVGGADIFYTLKKGFQVVLIKPEINNRFNNPRRTPVFASADDTVEIQITWSQTETQIDSLFLIQDTIQVAQTTDDTLNYTFYTNSLEPGFTGFKAIVSDTSGLSDTSSFEIMVNPVIEETARPSGVKPGINYIDNQTVTLALFAPYKEYVYVIGDFNDWEVNEDYYMKAETIGEDSIYWWLTIDGLTAGQEYAFQYLVDGDLRIADPYAKKTLDPWNDQYIDEDTYPGLIPYPENKTEQITAVLQTNQPVYEWKSTDYTPPDKSKLIIYELLIRDFIADHNYKTLIDTLDYLENLGVNAIELMPINEFEGNLSWGYNPSFYFAPDKYYGPAEDLKAFVDSCHSRGIAVIFDLVLNHVFGQSPFVQLYLDYYGSDEIVMKLPNPWFNRTSPNPAYKWGADFNHESPETQALVDRINKYWLTEFKVDGFRFDFTKGFTNTPGEGWNVDGTRINILKRMADEIWAVNPQAYVILEHLTDNAEETNLANYGMMLWGNLNNKYNEATMGYHSSGNSDFSWGYYDNRGWNNPALVTYMESHDEERLMFKNLEYGNSSGGYDIKNLTTALHRIKMAAAFFFTYPGPKMIWQFGELGYDYSIEYNGRTGNKPIRWDYLNDIDRNRLYRTFAALINLRNNHLTFNSSSTSVTMEVNSAVKTIRLWHGLMNAVIIGNFDVINQSGQPRFNKTGFWYDYFSGDSLNINNMDTLITLSAGEFHIFTDKKLPAPDEDLLTGIVFENAATIKNFNLEQNYPNPFNP